LILLIRKFVTDKTDVYLNESENTCNFFKKDFIYLFVREREREHKQGEWQAGGEADSLLSREPDVGLDPGTLGS